MTLAGVLKRTNTIFAILAVLPAIIWVYAWATGDARTAMGLAMCFGCSGMIWAMLTLTLIDTPPASGERAGLAIVAMFWLLVPPIACLPFMSSGVSDSWTAAMFEAISNLTTTGASASAADAQPDAIRLWRACLQWFGGTASVTMAVAIFSGFASSAGGLLRARAPFSTGAQMLKRTAWRAGAVYLGVGAVASLALVLTGTEPVSALEMAFAAVTTSSTVEGLSAPGGIIAPVALCAALIVGATNISLYSGLTPTRGFWRDPESSALLIGTALIAVGACILTGRTDIVGLLAQTLSFVTGSGMNVTASDSLIDVLAAPVPEFLALVGGAALSTTGGVKIIRMMSLGSMVRDEFRRLAFDHAPSASIGAKETEQDRALIYMMAYVLAIPVLLIGLSVTGAPLSMALRGAVGALTSHGPLLNAYLHTDTSPVTLVMLALGSVAGRVELLAFAPMIGITGWRR